MPALVAGIYVLRLRSPPAIATAAKAAAAAVSVNISQAPAAVAKRADIDTTPACGKIVRTSKLSADRWGMR